MGGCGWVGVGVQKQGAKRKLYVVVCARACICVGMCMEVVINRNTLEHIQDMHACI